MKKQQKWILPVVAIAAVGAVTAIGTSVLTGNVVELTTEYTKCQNMDVSKNGLVNTQDKETLRAYQMDPTTLRFCKGLPGTPTDPAILTRCKNFDVNKDDRINASDEIMLRNYADNASSLKYCPDDATLAKCQLMDTSKDGIVNQGDKDAFRAYQMDPNTLRFCKGLPGTPTDQKIMARCKNFDVNNDDRISASDEIGLRNYVDDQNTLKECSVSGGNQSSSSSSSSSSTPTCPVLGSTDLSTEITRQIDTRVAGLDANASTANIFSVMGNLTDPWTRNPTVWTSRNAQIDLTGISPWNSEGGTAKAGTLISPRHIAFANHYQISNGSTILFVDNQNAVVTRTLVSQRRVGTTDIQIGILDSDVPSSISYFPIMSFTDVGRYMRTVNVPILALNKPDNATVRDVVSLIGGFIYHMNPYAIYERHKFYKELIVGDSGSPGFFLINNKAVLVLTHHGALAGPFYGSYITEINQVMRDLGTEYQLTVADLSCFTPK